MLCSVKRRVDVVGAVIVRDGLVLCAQRGASGDQAGLWEFPGGKVESSEAPSAALVREIREELGCEIRVGAEITTTTHEYEAVVVRLTTFFCELVGGEPWAHEHQAVRWLEARALGELEWAPADGPTVEIVGR